MSEYNRMQVKLQEATGAYEWMQVMTSNCEPGVSDWKWLHVTKSNYGWTGQDQYVWNKYSLCE